MATSLSGLLSWMSATIEQQRGVFSTMIDIATQLEGQLDILDPPGITKDLTQSAGQEVLNVLALEREAKAYSSCVAEVRKALSFLSSISQSRSPTDVDQSKLSENIITILKGRKFLYESFADCSTSLLGEIQLGIDQSLLSIKHLISTKTQIFYAPRKALIEFLEGATRSVLFSGPAQSRAVSPMMQSANQSLELHALLRLHVQLFLNSVSRRLPNTPLSYIAKYITLASSLDFSINSQVLGRIYENGYTTSLSAPFLATFDALIASSTSPGTFKEAILYFLTQRINVLLNSCTSIVSAGGVLKQRAYSKLKGVPAFDTSKVGTETLLIALLDFLQKLPDKNRIKNSRELADYLFFNDTPSVPPINDSPIRGDTQLSLILRWLAHVHRTNIKTSVSSFNRSAYIKAIEDGPAAAPPSALYKQESHPFFYYFLYVHFLLLDEREQIISFISLILSHYTNDPDPFSLNFIAEHRSLVESACRLMDVCYAYVATPVLQYTCQVALGLLNNISTERLAYPTLDLLQVLHAWLPIVLFTSYTEILNFSIGGLPMTDSPCSVAAQAIGVDSTVYKAGCSFINGMGMNDSVLHTPHVESDTTSNKEKCTWNIPLDSVSNSIHTKSFSGLSSFYTNITEFLSPLTSDIVSCSLNHRNYLEQLLHHYYTKSDLHLSVFDSLRHDLLLLIVTISLKSEEMMLSFEDSTLAIATKTDSINVISELPNIILRLNQQGLFGKSLSIYPEVLKLARKVSPMLMEGVVKDAGASQQTLNLVYTEGRFTASAFIDNNSEFVLQDYILPAGAEALPSTSVEQKLYYLACVLCYKMQPHKNVVNNYLFKLNNLCYLCEATSSDTGLLKNLTSPEYSRFLRKQLDELIAKYYEKVWKPPICALGLSRLINDLQHVYKKWHERNDRVITKGIMEELSALLSQAREVAIRVEQVEHGTDSFVASEIQDEAETGGDSMKAVSHASIKSRRLAGTLSSCLPKFESMIIPLCETHFNATIPSLALQKKLQDYVANNVVVAVKQYYDLCQFSPITSNAFRNYEKILPQNIQHYVERFFGNTSTSAHLYPSTL